MRAKHRLLALSLLTACAVPPAAPQNHEPLLVLPSRRLAPVDGRRELVLRDFFIETAQGRTRVPAEVTRGLDRQGRLTGQWQAPDGRVVRLTSQREGTNFFVRLSAEPSADVLKWGLAIEAGGQEYFTGLMERVVDGPQRASWAPGITAAMDLRGQRVEMIIKPTTSVYAPFFLSSRGYAVLARTNWPGVYDFCAAEPKRVRIEFEGPQLELKIYTAGDPASLVRAHAMDTGPPVLPPKWMFTPWRWRDEHTHRRAYYDGTPVTGPFNSEIMEDVLMMKGYGIPLGVYWIDRPWGPGPLGYDDFEIDPHRLPNFSASVKWLNEQQAQMVLWIAPFFQGKMQEEAMAKGWTLAGQKPTRTGQNYPLVDLTNPAARTYWQEGVAKLLQLGVAGFKMDRAEEDIPESGPYKTFDGRSIRENRNAYVPMYVQAAYEVARKHRGDDFVLLPRAAYTGTAAYSAYWGGDIGGTQEGLRASIIAVQRSAVMGYSNWGSDTCGYNEQLMEQEVCGRWLAFSAFTPIFEVGPTRNLGFWNLNREPAYDAHLIAMWRMYARLHQRLVDYGYAAAQQAHRTGMPIVRPLFLVDPRAPEAWENWWTYLYGDDIVVSPLWEKGRREQRVYLPRGGRWRDAWNPQQVHDGGRTITVTAERHQMPVFVRVGANVQLGDLNRDWQESQEVAGRKPDLKELDAEVRAWFAGYQKKSAPR